MKCIMGVLKRRSKKMILWIFARNSKHSGGSYIFYVAKQIRIAGMQNNIVMARI